MNVSHQTKRAILMLALASLPGVGNGFAQTHLYLKGKRDVAATDLWKRPPLHRLSPNRSHVLIEFAGPPTSVELTMLRRHARILSYVPDYGYEISIPDGERLDRLPLSWIGRLQPDEKISPLLRNSPAGQVEEVVVEFHRDVTQAEKREVALRVGVTIHEHPDLLPNHLLVRGTLAQLRQMAAWDEVAYLFPASRELQLGLPVETCVGALTGQGSLGQSIPKIGDGWDGPGLGSANLKYAWVRDSAKLPSDSERGEIVRAFNEWAKYAQITFTQTNDSTAAETLAVLFATGQHGDPYPFQGLGTLAHTYYPFPTNPEPIAGDMHFNDAESWNIGADVDLFSVALHETGHALGLGHSDEPGAVMYPYYKRVTGLSPEDVGAILDLYAAQTADSPATPTPGTPATPPVTSPANPTPPSTPPVTPSAPLTLTVKAPPASTTSASLLLQGTLAGGTAPIQVYWITDQGWSGNIQGAPNWSAANIPLHAGLNTIAAVARDASGNQATAVVTVTRAANVTNPPPTTPTTPPATPSNPTTTATTPTNPGSAAPPTLDITSPFTTTVYTSKSLIVVKGTASDTAGIASITWSTSAGTSGTANGTTRWQTPAIPLYVGTNTIRITALDSAGNTSWRVVMVTRN